ncbi:MAG: 16S rRNA (guanine(966)-N(2))-methyltransferase RsmD [Eggerthellaceae bacterium]|nr:16S rRNA (guanine(966)-N(2))-methyltransferase RsmD [Eggerthellaceae bacterium]
MRIIAGEYKGRQLKAPKGDATRPTADRVREALMSALASARGGFEGAVVLDAFAGSGALGLEALSRGARYAAFCEKDASALRTLQANIEALGVARERYAALRTDILKNPPRLAAAPFDLVFLDPPYALEPPTVSALLEGLGENGQLAPQALIVYEHAKSKGAAVAQAFEPARWERAFHKGYGDTVVDILSCHSPE